MLTKLYVRRFDVGGGHLQSYIDFEIGEGERERCRELYERLLQRTHHVKVWMSYADFEAAPMPEARDEDEDEQALAARRAQAAQSGPESVASREARARRCLPHSAPAAVKLDSVLIQSPSPATSCSIACRPVFAMHRLCTSIGRQRPTLMNGHYRWGNPAVLFWLF